MNRYACLSKDAALILIFGAFTLLMIVLAVAGAFLSYSPVPYWDMWDGYIGFFTSLTDGYLGAWWDNHNEHRIVLSRVLFWADLKLFDGAGWFLIAANYFIVGASVLVFWRILRNAAAAEKPTTGEILLGFFVTAWLFQWMQYQNLTEAFQSSFILAQLLPLCALYWLHKSVIEINARRSFLIACGFGVASVGSMANGILALPLMTFYALLLRQGAVRVGLLATLSLVSLLLYFHNYSSLPYGSISQTFRENPSNFIQFFLLYIGSPFYHLCIGAFDNAQVEFCKLIAQFAGMALIGCSAWFAIKAVRKPKDMSLQLAMLFFILYIGGTAFGTTGHRLMLGVNYAVASRYTTPALMAWCALIVLYTPYILASIRSRGLKSLFLVAVLGFLMINAQRQALQSQDDNLFERKIAALALELRVKDEKQIKYVYPHVQHVLPVAEKASTQNLSIFGMYPFRDAREQLGTSVQQLALPACQGSLEEVAGIDGEACFVRVNGWIFKPAGKNYPDVIRFLGSQNKVVGYALTGQIRPDVAGAIDKKALQAGFQGYLLADQMNTMLTLRGESPDCQLQTKAPIPLFSLASTKSSADKITLVFSLASTKSSADSVTLGSANVLPGNQWLGSDYYRSVIDGMQVYGSHIDSDANVGAISLRIKRGDRILYRSGPSGGQQFLDIFNTALLPVKLPVSTDWALLDLNSIYLPNGPFIVKLSDNGLGWGEWSAVAVRHSGN